MEVWNVGLRGRREYNERKRENEREQRMNSSELEFYGMQKLRSSNLKDAMFICKRPIYKPVSILTNKYI